MTETRFENYSGAAPILLPVSILHYWRGFYLPADPEDGLPDLELPDGAFNICDDFDFANPKTDYDRACSLSRAVETISVGPGKGLVFGAELDSLTWWQDQRMLVNGGLPTASRLNEVTWSDELNWHTAESDFVLMNACDHGADPNLKKFFDVELAAGEYLIQRGDSGDCRNVGSEPAFVLFRFLLKFDG